MDFYRVFPVCGHYEARNMNGDFILSADTEPEAWKELESETEYDMY